MQQKDIDRIAEVIAAKLGEPGGAKLLGCGSASSSQNYYCSTQYECSGSSYECGGNNRFECEDWFLCHSGTTFNCDSRFNCPYQFYCEGTYN